MTPIKELRALLHPVYAAQLGTIADTLSAALDELERLREQPLSKVVTVLSLELAALRAELVRVLACLAKADTRMVELVARAVLSKEKEQS